MQGGQVVRERFPRGLAIIASRKCLEQDQLLSNREDVRRLQMAGSTQGGQALSLGPEHVSRRVGHGLGDHTAAVGVDNQPYIRHVPAGHRTDRGNAALKPESAQLTPKAVMPGPCRRRVSLRSGHINSVRSRSSR